MSCTYCSGEEPLSTCNEQGDPGMPFSSPELRDMPSVPGVANSRSLIILTNRRHSSLWSEMPCLADDWILGEGHRKPVVADLRHPPEKRVITEKRGS